MVHGDMVLTNGVYVQTFFYIDACTIDYNSSFSFVANIYI
jgi:hypothetical protein